MAAVHPLPLILASASASRKKLLAQTGLTFTCLEPAIDEQAITANLIRERVVAVARAKNEAVVTKTTQPALILSADTVVVFKNTILEKPRFKMTALEMLKKLNGHIHTVITGWTVFNSHKETWQFGFSETFIKFRDLTHQELLTYVDNHPVTQWAGGYNSQLSSAVTFIERIEGSLTGLNGLPLEQVMPALKKEWDHPYKTRPKRVGRPAKHSQGD
jgi:septum formation protein